MGMEYYSSPNEYPLHGSNNNTHLMIFLTCPLSIFMCYVVEESDTANVYHQIFKKIG